MPKLISVIKNKPGILMPKLISVIKNKPGIYPSIWLLRLGGCGLLLAETTLDPTGSPCSKCSEPTETRKKVQVVNEKSPCSDCSISLLRYV